MGTHRQSAMPSGIAERTWERVPAVGDEEYDHNKPLMRVQATEQRVRDYFVAVESAKLARTKLKQCYRTETVNHTQNCVEQVADYMKKSALVMKLQNNQFGKAGGDDD